MSRLSLSRSAVLGAAAPLAVIVGLGLAFFAPLASHPADVLYSDYSDLLALHLPSRCFLVRSYQETGELPLWCPCSFAGMPFIHDPQASAFYPPHWPLLLLPPAWLGSALSWLVVLHVIAAGLCTYAYARHQGLGRGPAVVAGLGWMFAGKWLLHLLAAGHYNMVPLAWLPLVLLGLERAIRNGSLAAAVAAGAAFALVVLGAYPYMTFYAGLFVALWTLTPALERAGYLGGERVGSLPAALGRWLGYGACTAVVAVGLAAVQLLPGLEAVGSSTRAGYAAPIRDTLAGGLRSLLALTGPSPSEVPPSLIWEERGGFGIVALVALAWAYVLGDRRRRFQVGLCLLLFAFGLGGSAAVQKLPGFSFFRFPSRMFMVAALPVALLAGAATQALFPGAGAGAAVRRCRVALVLVTAAAVVLAGASALLLRLAGGTPRWSAYWLAPAAALPLAFWLVGSAAARPRPALLVLWATLLLAEPWALARPWVAVCPAEEFYPPSVSVDRLAERRGDLGRVLDRDAGAAGDTPLGTGAPIALLRDLEPLRGFNPIDVRRYKEYLQLIADGEGPLRPLDNPLTFPALGDLPLVNRNLLDLLGARYLLQPSDRPLPGTGWSELVRDPSPAAYNFNAGGVRRLPPYTLYENEAAFPRAFTVPEAAPLPEPGRILPALKATDFRRRVLLEDWGPSGSVPPQGEFRPVRVSDYRPNRVSVEVDGEAPSFLVLTDIWYPGWVATVDGQPAPLYRANYVFRAVPVPAGRHEVSFAFEPLSYRRGRLVSAVTLVVAVLVVGAGALLKRHRRGGTAGAGATSRAAVP